LSSLVRFAPRELASADLFGPQNRVIDADDAGREGYRGALPRLTFSAAHKHIPRHERGSASADYRPGRSLSAGIFLYAPLTRPAAA
jgi:hypothetical protein